MNRKSSIIALCAAVALVLTLPLAGCDAFAKPASVTLVARLASAASRVVSPGDPVTVVSSYRVSFKKVEIGIPRPTSSRSGRAPTPTGSSRISPRP